MTPTQQVIVKHDGILLIRELPDTVKLKETEAEAYSAVWDLMIQIEKELPMAYVFTVGTLLWKMTSGMMKLVFSCEALIS